MADGGRGEGKGRQRVGVPRVSLEMSSQPRRQPGNCGGVKQRWTHGQTREVWFYCEVFFFLNEML